MQDHLTDHPLALTLAVVIDAYTFDVPEEALERHIYLALDDFLPNWPDERLADLYSRLVESVEFRDTFSELHRKVNDALNRSDEEYFRE
jgi:hypothetical protein